MACRETASHPRALRCDQCGALYPRVRALSKLAEEVNARCGKRWRQLQLLSAASKKVVTGLVARFLAFLEVQGVPPSLFAATPYDVVCFFMENDEAGRTVVHEPTCPYIRSKTSIKNRLCDCPRRLAWSSLDATVGSLRGAFRDLGHGADGPWCYRTNTGNPCNSHEVRLFLATSGKEQLAGGVATKRAALFDKSAYKAFQRGIMSGWRRSKGTALQAARAAADAMFFSTMWHTGLRAADTLRLLQQKY